jgi:H+-transporting ATPase
MPEHKFQIVQVLRERGLVVGMTGDGVNDAPALKRADIGIAVDDATDAAKAAADIVLTEPGLSVIIDAIRRSRKIFQRMRNYAIYRIACTIELLFFFFFAIVSMRMNSDTFYGMEQAGCAEHNPYFTLPVISIVVITILNDGTIITIAHDKVIPANSPQKWDLKEVVFISTVLGGVACIGSIIILVGGLKANCTNGSDDFWGVLLGSGEKYVTFGQMQSVMYLKVSISDFLTVFSGRCRWFFWERRPGYALAVAFVFATACSTILSLFWPFKETGEPMTGLQHNSYAVISVWIFCILFFFVQDIIKVLCSKAWAFI